MKDKILKYIFRYPVTEGFLIGTLLGNGMVWIIDDISPNIGTLVTLFVAMFVIFCIETYISRK
jgi:hypothetical protein